MRLPAMALLCVVLVAGCFQPDAPTTGTPPATTTPVPTTTTTPTPAVTTPAPSQEGLRFDGGRALDLVREQVLYPNGTVRTRVPGTPGNAEVARWIAGSMADEGYDVSWHHFNATYGCERVAMHNVVAERAGTSGRVVAFAAHYDTRPIADKDDEEARRDEPIAGANDGGSGVAVLMELARVLPPTEDTVRFLFFDGEDGGGYKGRDCTDWILGSRAYADSLSAEEAASIRAFVLVDMVGDPDLRIPWEGYSRNGPGRPVLDAVFAAAHGLGHRQFVNESGYSITDDHVPFVQRGIPAIDLIHTMPPQQGFFPAWHHTHDDDLDGVSAESLAAVGRTLEEWTRAGAPVAVPS